MKISLIGMSGSGKSYWSQKLQQKGFKRFCCDDLIEKELVNELKRLGYTGIQDVAEWMGQPFEVNYEYASEAYLHSEQKVLGKIFEKMKNIPENEDIVIDTTGSVIYMKEFILSKLAQLTKIIYLDIPESVKEEMFSLYLKEPKPVIWGDSFRRIDEESNLEALAKCYPELLAFRAKEYKKLADMKLDYYFLRNTNVTVDTFIEAIL